MRRQRRRWLKVWVDCKGVGGRLATVRSGPASLSGSIEGKRPLVSITETSEAFYEQPLTKTCHHPEAPHSMTATASVEVKHEGWRGWGLGTEGLEEFGLFYINDQI